ncbi:hypothetical protein CY34DRAFT_812321 [Suillus luteus UH-Slu-Lm8-n1]|uniref:Unplaced genomic scaffold CY34scaffold_515, whole genome shotgun sequence n=1 Tax=Suillus luteus UH-Slu-Lm8-n1 TaxID=930992 RepID=A0A0D0ALX8_9AGAM|nr:hypothetical protein CY34DRAFT_812321 [Suillus luteus UH-Slu-Lm8-n1]
MVAIQVRRISLVPLCMYVPPPFLNPPYQTWHHSKPLLLTESRERVKLTSFVKVALSSCFESRTPFSGRSGGGPLDTQWVTVYRHLVHFSIMSRDAEPSWRITNGDISRVSSLWYFSPELLVLANRTFDF